MANAIFIFTAYTKEKLCNEASQDFRALQDWSVVIPYAEKHSLSVLKRLKVSLRKYKQYFLYKNNTSDILVKSDNFPCFS
jgi:hypothetical protein